MALLENLKPEQVYLVKVSASNKMGDGPFSHVVELKVRAGLSSGHNPRGSTHSTGHLISQICASVGKNCRDPMFPICRRYPSQPFPMASTTWTRAQWRGSPSACASPSSASSSVLLWLSAEAKTGNQSVQLYWRQCWWSVWRLSTQILSQSSPLMSLYFCATFYLPGNFQLLKPKERVWVHLVPLQGVLLLRTLLRTLTWLCPWWTTTTFLTPRYAHLLLLGERWNACFVIGRTM